MRNVLTKKSVRLLAGTGALGALALGLASAGMGAAQAAPQDTSYQVTTPTVAIKSYIDSPWVAGACNQLNFHVEGSWVKDDYSGWEWEPDITLNGSSYAYVTQIDPLVPVSGGSDHPDYRAMRVHLAISSVAATGQSASVTYTCVPD